MKFALRIFLAAVLISAAFFFVNEAIVPFVCEKKETCFLMPVGFTGRPETGKELPVRNDSYGEGAFGAKRRGGRRHKGIDLEAPLKSPVYASKSGRAKVLFYPKGYGNLVIIDHPGGWQTRYGHLDEVLAKSGRWIWQGEIIGKIGKTGNADSKGIIPHLHFEIRKEGRALDPAPLLVKYGEK